MKQLILYFPSSDNPSDISLPSPCRTPPHLLQWCRLWAAETASFSRPLPATLATVAATHRDKVPTVHRRPGELESWARSGNVRTNSRHCYLSQVYVLSYNCRTLLLAPPSICLAADHRNYSPSFLTPYMPIVLTVCRSRSLHSVFFSPLLCGRPVVTLGQ